MLDSCLVKIFAYLKSSTSTYC